MVSQLNFIFTHEVLLLLQISILVSSWVPPAFLSLRPSLEILVIFTLSLPEQTCFVFVAALPQILLGNAVFLA